MTNEQIQKVFENPGSFIAFLTGGDPDKQTTLSCIEAIERAGADLIEIGIPFSDPCAEGPVIEAADLRALQGGMDTNGIFRILRTARERGLTIPIVFMTYANPVYKYGIDAFMKDLHDAGGCGVIIPDVPFEESQEFRDAAKANGICLISMIAPTSDERISMIAKEADGFIYLVSSMGVTGVREKLSGDISGMVKQIREVTDVPCAVGFGIATPEQAEKISQVADGAIVGSAIVRIIEKYGTDSPAYVEEYVREMKKACLSGAKAK